MAYKAQCVSVIMSIESVLLLQVLKTVSIGTQQVPSTFDTGNDLTGLGACGCHVYHSDFMLMIIDPILCTVPYVGERIPGQDGRKHY